MILRDFPPSLRLWAELGEVLARAADVGYERAQRELRRRPRRGFGRVRRPGAETPLWNAVAGWLREELRPPGAKARLARYLGIPRQRVTDYVTGRRRLPDAEVLLRMLDWTVQRRQGRDVSV